MPITIILRFTMSELDVYLTSSDITSTMFDVQEIKLDQTWNPQQQLIVHNGPRGALCTRYDGYVYRYKKTLADGVQKMWICTTRRCNGKLYSHCHVYMDSTPHDHQKRCVLEIDAEVIPQQMMSSDLSDNLIKEKLSELRQLNPFMPSADAVRQRIQRRSRTTSSSSSV